MPIHDWSRVFDGAFHAFHHAWIAELQIVLNSGLLPSDYYAMAEQVVRPAVPDVLTLQTAGGGHGIEGRNGGPVGGAIAVAVAPPRVRLHESLKVENFTKRQRSIVVRHASDDRIVAFIEILSAGNKGSTREFQAFVAKALSAIAQGIHLLLVDIHPRIECDPNGIHAEIWSELGDNAPESPQGLPLTLVAYDAAPPPTCYVEPTAVGETLIDMPLFLEPEWYISVPLEATYQAAWRGVPQRFRGPLEAVVRTE